MRYALHYAVTGRPPFPIDMLRYDASFPAGERDAGLIHQTLDHHFSLDHPDTIEAIQLTAYVAHARAAPTFGRWESFGWHVVSDSIRTVKIA